jgi:hypothetical protein
VRLNGLAIGLSVEAGRRARGVRSRWPKMAINASRVIGTLPVCFIE